MKSAPKIVYETHPVTPERKAELRAQHGSVKIIDVRFAPDDHLPEAAAQAAAPTLVDEPVAEPVSLDGLDRAELAEKYFERFEKQPHHAMKDETIIARLIGVDA